MHAVKLHVLVAALFLVHAAPASAQPAEPAPAEPAPAEPVPAEPAPAEPAPADGMPAEPAPDDTAPPEPEPAPVEEAPVEAAPVSDSGDAWIASVAPRVGLAVPTSKLSPFAVGGLELAFATPVAARRLLVALDVSMTYPSHSGTVMDPRVGGTQTYEIDEREIKVSLDAIYRIFGPDRALVPWAGAGPVLHFLKSRETTSIAPGKNVTTNAELGFEITAGVDYRLGPGYAVGDLRILYTDLSHYLTGNSNAGNVDLSVGYRLVF